MSATIPAIAVIPARGGSKRLPRKNVCVVAGKPLVQWAIEAALGSSYLGPGAVFVSTDDAEVMDVARAAGAEVIVRPAELAGDAVWTEPVIRHAVETVEAEGRAVELVAWMNACIPEITSADVDRAFQRLLNENLREVISVDARGKSHSGIRLLRREALSQHSLSVVFATLIFDYIDVHTAEDLAVVEQRLRSASDAT